MPEPRKLKRMLISTVQFMILKSISIEKDSQ